MTTFAGRFTSYKAEEFKPGAHPQVVSAQTSVIVARIKEELRKLERRHQRWKLAKLAIQSKHAFLSMGGATTRVHPGAEDRSTLDQDSARIDSVPKNTAH